MRIFHISNYHISGNNVERDKNILITENLIKKVKQIQVPLLFVTVKQDI